MSEDESEIAEMCVCFLDARAILPIVMPAVLSVSMTDTTVNGANNGGACPVTPPFLPSARPYPFTSS